jgi:hypothetical protein
MPTFAPASDAADIELPEPGRYIVKCVAIEDAPDKGFGPGIKWVFQLIHPDSGVTIQSNRGGAYELWQFTSVKLGAKAKARPIVEALLGRSLQVREVPNDRDLVGRSMLAMLIHEPRDDGSERAVLTMCKPYAAQDAAPAPSAAPTMPRPAPNASGQGGLLAQIKAAVRKSEILQTPRHLEFVAMEDAALQTMSDGDLYSILQEINADIQAA